MPREDTWSHVGNYVENHHDTYPFIHPTLADMSGKSVLITGASKGVGEATALSFAKAGCSKIAIAARSPLDKTVKAVKEAAAAAQRPEPLVLPLEMDVTSEASV
jgi:NAD(P)-dependent dehydrogenase (short-subunit alcohol dehydrogenase family)